ncbi:MAG: nuclear transport factor 2 family protein [bacterium]
MRFYSFFSILLLLFIGCQPKSEIESIDLAAEKNEINIKLENYHTVSKAKDFDAYKDFLTDDGLFCGTDPEEFWDNEQWLGLVEKSFANKSRVSNYSIEKREIKVAANGISAIAVEQISGLRLSKKILARVVYHFVKTDDDWKVDFLSWALVPKNDDLSKLNEALE